VRNRPVGTGVIVSYHPPIFRPLKALTLADPIQASLLRCAADGVAVFSPHTALDSAQGGINDFLAEAILTSTSEEGQRVTVATAAGIRAIKYASDPPEGHEHAGIGKFVELERRIGLDDLVRRVKSNLGLGTGKKTLLLYHPLVRFYIADLFFLFLVV
jgi:putative NIF3 family GTP cyclohydrolase 1 type 2